MDDLKHNDSDQHYEPSIWGQLEVENKKGKANGKLPITQRDCTIGR